MKKIYTVAISLFIAITWAMPSYALRETKPLPIDRRLHIMVYNPNDVFKFVGHYGYQSSIIFGEGEEVGTISMGDSLSWQIVPQGNRIFLKPMEPNADTNMTVLTNRHEYQFELHAREVEKDKGMDDDQLVFTVKFVYPDEAGGGDLMQLGSLKPIDLTEPGKYNFSYMLSGSEFIAPIKVFDDKEFTYFEFRDKNAEVPAIFLVDSEGKEGLVNYRMVGNYVVVERVASRFTLRHGPDVVCIFNDGMPYRKAKVKKSWWQFWK